MILVDSSAWIEFLTESGSFVCDEVSRLLDADIVVTEPILLKVLAGARTDRHLAELRGLLGRANVLRCEWTDWLLAAHLYQRCRANGETVKQQMSCLDAAVAIRHEVPVLHHDRDFDVLARHTELRVHGPA